jgi:ABC-type antimicrobial peptide transport system permease subunit
VAGDARVDVAVRTELDVADVAVQARAILRDIDPLLPLSNITTIETHLTRALSERRLAMVLVAAFGAVALLLAVIGTYTLLATSVSQRSRELGVRLAMGARPGAIVGMVLRGALGVVMASGPRIPPR